MARRTTLRWHRRAARHNGDGRADLREKFGAEGGSGLALRDSTLYHATWDAVYRYHRKRRPAT